MKNLKYALRQVFKMRWNNLVKLISLTLGLVIGGSLFVRVAFERSFDRDLKDVERIYRVEATYTSATGDKGSGTRIMAPVVPTLQAAIPQIECVTRFLDQDKMIVSADDENFFEAHCLVVDSSFFDIFSYGVVRGDPHKELAVSGNMYLSEKCATKIFGSTDPVGKTLTVAGMFPLTVAGIFTDIAANSHIQCDAVAYLADYFPTYWDGGDSFNSYIKLLPGVAVADVEARFKGILDPFHAEYTEIQKMSINYFTNPVRNIAGDSSKQLNIIMAILALIVILVSSLNYVLLTLSSLSSRAKEVGVHKASGASSGDVFAIILWETFIYVILSICFASFILVACRGFLEGVMGSYEYLFTLGNLWALIVVVALLFLLAGIIPASIFARIPVAQIFRRYTDGKMLWKRALLFFQFFAAAFIVSFVIIIIVQYNTIATYNLGYNHTDVGFVELTADEMEPVKALRSQIEGMSGVGEVSLGNSLPMTGSMSGIGVSDPQTHERFFRADNIQIDERFLPLFRIPVIRGRNLTARDSAAVVVNEAFVSKLKPGTNPLGYTFTGEGQLWSVVGVVPDIKIGSFYNEVGPVVFTSFTWVWAPNLLIRFTDYSDQNVASIEKRLKELAPKQNYKITRYSTALAWQHTDVANLRNGVLVACLVLLFITFLGVVGYTATEIRRRRSEMALRKINGATRSNVIALMLRSLLVICVIACACGIVAAYMVGEYWQQNFTAKAGLGWWIFALGAAVVTAMVIATVAIQSRHIVNSNPARYIKNE